MNNKPVIAWTDFYQELADKLLPYRDDRRALVEKLKEVHSSLGLTLPTLDNVSPVIDIDPFTFFGTFNKGIKNERRTAILSAMKQEFGLKSAVPDTFEGIPVLMNLSANFFRFSNSPDRGEHDIDNLWAAFSDALAYADHQTESSYQAFSTSFDAVHRMKGNNFKLTMGLYWIRPYAYINLDERNRWYILERSGLPQELADEIGRMKKVPPPKTT